MASAVGTAGRLLLLALAAPLSLRRARRITALVLVFCAGAVFVPVPLAAQQEGGDTDRHRSELRVQTERLYRVVIVRGGVVLVPRTFAADAVSIEVTDGTIAIDGEVVTGSELVERLGEAAPVVLALSYLDPPERHRLFARTPVGEPPVAPPAEGPQVRRRAAPETPPFPGIERRRVGSRVRIGGDVVIAEDELARDEVVAVLGSVTVDGRVDGDVVAVGGSVFLGPRSEVRGDVTVVGGRLRRQEGALLTGRVNEISFALPRVRVAPFRRDMLHPVFPYDPGWAPAYVFGTLVRLALIGLLAAIALAVASGPVDRVGWQAGAEPWKAGAVGLLVQLLFLPLLIALVVVLVVTIIGIPLLVLVPFVLLALMVAMLLGFAGIATRVGGWASRRFGWRMPGPFAMLLIGLAVLWALTLVGRLAGLAGPPVRLFAGSFLVAGFVVEYIAWTVGLGAVILSGFGRRPRALEPVPPVAAPPDGANTPAPPGPMA
jgi:hypothetical protein